MGGRGGVVFSETLLGVQSSFEELGSPSARNRYHLYDFRASTGHYTKLSGRMSTIDSYWLAGLV